MSTHPVMDAENMHQIHGSPMTSFIEFPVQPVSRELEGEDEKQQHCNVHDRVDGGRPGVRSLDEVITVSEGRKVGQYLRHGRDLFERYEDAGDEDERKSYDVEHRHDIARALGRVRGEEGPHRRKTERGQEDSDDERDYGEDRGPEDYYPCNERDGSDHDAVQEPAQAFAEDYRVQGDGGGDETVECLHPPLNRDGDRLDRRC